MPASSILLLDADEASARGDRVGPDRRRLHRHARPPTRTRRSPRPPTTSSSSSTSSTGPKTAVEVCREIRAHARPWPAIPVLCVSQTDDVEERIALPRGRRRRRHGPAVRRPRARGPGRGAAPALPALARPDPGRLGRRPRRRPGAPDGRRLQPQGRRRDDDHRDEHRRRRGAQPRRTGSSSSTWPSSSAASRPTSTSSPSRPSPTSSATRRRCASRSSCGRTRCATTAGCTSSPRRARPRARSSSTPAHVAQILTTLLEGYDSSSSTPARRSTSGR